MSDDPVFALSAVARGVQATPKKALVVADAIAEEISAKGLSPGTPLATEAEMLSEFGVGRGTLREALRLLEAEGIIEVRAGANGGTLVGVPSLDRLSRLLSILLSTSGATIREVMAARRLFEPEMCALAAANADAADVERLTALVQQSEGARDDVARMVALSSDFHDAVAVASKNHVLATFWLASSRIVSRQVGVSYHHANPEQAHHAHLQILAAIRKRSVPQARRAMAGHMEAVFSYLEQTLGADLASAVRFQSDAPMR
jgi:DNA-binding FadR family transcriptional regulator